eukprot:1518323-Prymnesium_polylepis.1
MLDALRGGVWQHRAGMPTVCAVCAHLEARRGGGVVRGLARATRPPMRRVMDLGITWVGVGR